MEFRRILLGLGVVPVLAGAALFGACGDDDDGGGGGGGSDEDFVADFCEILKNFNEDIDNIDPSDVQSEDDIADVFADPFEAFANDFEDLNPPSDLEDWHSEASDRLNDLVDDLKSGEFDESALEDNPLPDPPEDVQERFQNLADENEDCQDADFNFDE